LLATSIAVLALPAAANAEYLVPPGNSAATQYTESIPTAGGHSDAEKPSKQGHRTPTEILGSHNAQQLESQGEAGREAAEFAAETAPGGAVPTSASDRPGGESDSEPEQGTGGAGGRAGDGPNGSSGVGQTIAQATGSSGPLGALLPLAIVGAAAWALAFFLRQRNRPTP
jgi:hypothetical protein